jgi:hypothetical protein
VGRQTINGPTTHYGQASRLRRARCAGKALLTYITQVTLAGSLVKSCLRMKDEGAALPWRRPVHAGRSKTCLQR